MANTPLTGNSISTSYQGLLKAGDSGAIGATEKPITDGLANASTLSLGTTSASFTGTLDLSGATVTGLPDNNTTYDLASAQNASDVDVTLTGSDATADTVKLVAGSNITLTDSGTNQITIDAAGGGGGGAGTFNFQTSQIPAVSAFGTQDARRIIAPLWGYSTQAGYTFSANEVVFVPFLAKEGSTISDFNIDVSTPQAASTFNVGIYKAYVDPTNGYLYPEYHATAASGISSATAGGKSVTGLSITLPTTEDNVYFWAFQPDTAGVRFTSWSNWVSLPYISAGVYRINGIIYNAPTSTLPTGQIVTTGGTTDAMFNIKWK